MVKRRRNTGDTGIFSRFFRSVVTIVVLSAFVLFVSLFIRELSSFDINKFTSLTNKILTKANIDINEDKIGQVAGEFAERLSDTGIVDGEPNDVGDVVDHEEGSSDGSTRDVKVAIFSDIHSDYGSLQKALGFAKNKGIETIFVLGDLTEYGSVEGLEEVKDLLDSSGIEYFVIPGDHDLAESVGSDNFLSVFDSNDYMVEVDGKNILMFDNSANFTKIKQSRMLWFKDMAESADLVFLSQPLFSEGLTPPFNSMYMGSTRDEVSEEMQILQEQVRDQRDELLETIRDYRGIMAVFSGDHHKEDEIEDTERNSLTHHTVGAITEEIGTLPQALVQSPRFLILSFIGRDYKVSDVLLD